MTVHPQSDVHIPALLDEIMNPQTSKKTGRPYYKLSVRVPGEGVGEIFVSEEDYSRLRAASPERDASIVLVYTLRKFNGTFEPRLNTVALA